MVRSMMLAGILLSGMVAPAQTAKDGTAEDRAAIEHIAAAQAEAWNRHDAKAFAERFAADGGFTNIVGMQTYGKAPFEQQHAVIFSTIYKDSSVKLTVGKIRFVRPDVAIVDIDAVLTGYSAPPPGMTPPADGVMRTKLQEVMVKEPTGWWVTAFHNVVIQPARKP